MRPVKLYLAQPQRYPDQARDVPADGLFFYDHLLPVYRTTVDQCLRHIYGRKKPAPVAISYVDHVEVDGKIFPLALWEGGKAAVAPLLANQPEILFCDGYSRAGAEAATWLRWVRREIERRSPGTQLHLMGCSLKEALKHRVESFDIDFAEMAIFDLIGLPNGERLSASDSDAKMAHLPWLRAVGMMPAEIKTFEQIVEFNIRSAIYSLEYFHNNPGFQLPRIPSPSPGIGEEGLAKIDHAALAEARAAVMEVADDQQAKRRDGVVCDNCRRRHCDLRLANSVCMKNAQFVAFIKQTGVRDVDEIRSSVDYVQGRRGERINRMLVKEEEVDGFSKDLSAEMSSFVKDDLAIAKLADPSLDPENKSGTIVIRDSNVQMAVGLANRRMGGELNAADDEDRPVIPATEPAEESRSRD